MAQACARQEAGDHRTGTLRGARIRLVVAKALDYFEPIEQGGGAGGGTRTPTGRARRIFLPSTAFAAAGRGQRLGSGLSLHHACGCPSGLGAARLVSTPSAISCGLARDYQLKGFPEFEQFYISDFPLSTQFWFKSVASTIPPRPHTEGRYRQEVFIGQDR